MIPMIERLAIRGGNAYPNPNTHSRICLPLVSKLFKNHVHSSTEMQEVVISPECKKELIENLHQLRRVEEKRHIFDGPPIPGDKFYDVFVRNLAETLKEGHKSS